MKPITTHIDTRTRRKLRRHVWIGQVLHRNPRLHGVLLRLRDALVSVCADHVNQQDDLDYGSRPSRSSDSFSDVMAFATYASEINDPRFAEMWARPEAEAVALGNRTEASPVLFRRQVDVLGGLLAREPTIKTVLNFGVSYAYVDALLAGRFAERTFCGVDQSRHVKALNEAEFGHHSNMSFFHGDVFELLNDRDVSAGALFHSRTLCTLPQAFVERLYRTCFEKGMRYVVGFEQFGLPRQGEPFTFDETDRPSIPWRNLLTIHNYPGLLVKSGFKIETAFVFEVSRWSPDFRVLCVVANRS